MPIPSPQERPDLYDYYDGLPEGHQSAVKVKLSPFSEQMIKDRQAQLAKERGKPATEKQQAPPT